MFTRIAIFIVTFYRIYSADGAYAKAISDRIIFPGETLENKYGDDSDAPIIVPESCRHLTYCFEKPVNYPQERYNKMFEGKNLAPLPTIVESSIDDRLADDEYEDDCDAVVRNDPLFLTRNTKQQWRYVVQAPEHNFQQTVRSEICMGDPNFENKTQSPSSCFKNYRSYGGITTVCRQKKAKYELVVDNGKNGVEKFVSELPSCCVCHFKAPI